MARRKRIVSEDDALRPADMNMGHEVEPYSFDDSEVEGGEFTGTPINKDDDLNKEPMTKLESKAGNILKITEKLSRLSPREVKEIALRIREEDEHDKDEDEEEEKKDCRSESYYSRYLAMHEEDDGENSQKVPITKNYGKGLDDEDEDEDEKEDVKEYRTPGAGDRRTRKSRKDRNMRRGPQVWHEEEEDKREKDREDDEEMDEGTYSSRMTHRARYESEEVPPREDGFPEQEWDDHEWDGIGDEDEIHDEIKDLLPDQPALGESRRSRKRRFNEADDVKDRVNVIIGDDDEDEDEDEKADKKHVDEQISKLRKEDLRIRYNIANLFEGHDFTPSFKKKIRESFTAAVLAGVKDNLRIIAENEIKSRRRLEAQMRQEMIENVDQYLTYVAEEFVEENRLAIEAGLKLEIAESFMLGMKELFESHYIEVPQARRDIFEDIAVELEQNQEKLTRQISRNVALREENEGLKRDRAITKVGVNLTETQRDRLTTLSEGLDYTTGEEFEGKLIDLARTFILPEGRNYNTNYGPMITENNASTIENVGGRDSYVSAAAKYLKEGVI